METKIEFRVIKAPSMKRPWQIELYSDGVFMRVWGTYKTEGKAREAAAKLTLNATS